MSSSKNSFKPAFVIGGFLIAVVKVSIFTCILKKFGLSTVEEGIILNIN